MKVLDNIRLSGDQYTPYFEFWKQFQDFEEGFVFNQKQRVSLSEKDETTSVRFEWSSAATDTVVKLTNDNDSAIFVVVVSALGILLKRYADQSNVIIKAPLLTSASVEHKYSNDVPLCLAVDEATSLRDLLKNVQDVVKRSYKYQDFPIELLAADRGVKDIFRSNILIRYDAIHEQTSVKGYDLQVSFGRTQHGFRVEIIYSANVFDTFFIENIQQHFNNVLLHFDNTDQPVANVSILTAEEKAWLKRVNETTRPFLHDDTIVSMFEQQVEKSPDAIAVVFEHSTMTYDALNREANKLALNLRERFKVKRDSIVGLMVDRSEKMVLCILGILKAGAAYLPIDSSYPVERIRYITENAGVDLLITESSMLSVVEFFQGSLFAIDVEWDGLVPSENLKRVNDPNDLAYVIYTSGSSGNPKGVMIEHRSNVNMALHQVKEFRLTADDNVLQFASLSFDASVFEITMTLLSGASLVIVNKTIIHDQHQFVNYLEEKKVSVVTLPPSFLNILPQEELKFLRVIITAGEAPITKDALFHAQHSEYYNAYGPTECAVCVSAWKVPKEMSPGLPIPIGFPIANTQLYIVDEAMRQVPVGVIGEILIGGIGVSRGYMNLPELTKAKFINAFTEDQREYRSGDLGKYLPDGSILYIGRKDNQIKLRGYRIELSEIENMLSTYPGVATCLVVVKEVNGEKALVGYVKTNVELENPVDVFSGFLKAFLPDYMLPQYYVLVDVFPVTVNGKIDQSKLPLPSVASEIAIKLPESETEKTISGLWLQVLKCRDISIDQNYFSIGGDSLKAIQLVVLIQQTLGVNVDASDIYTYPTIESLSAYVDGKQKDSGENSLTPGLEKIALLKKTVMSETVLQDVSDNIEEVYPMVPIEIGMIYTSLLRPQDPVYYEQMYYEVEAGDFDRVKTIVALLTQKHDIFRTCYYLTEFSEPLKIVLDNVALPIHLEDVSEMSVPEQIASINNYVAADRNTRLTFNGELLWKMKFFKRSPESFFGVLSLHHAMFDGLSQQLLIKEIEELSKLDTLPARLVTLKHCYKDYCASLLARKSNGGTVDFWKRKLEGYSRNKLPFNYSGKRRKDENVFSSIQAHFDVSVLKKLETVAYNEKVSLKSICLGAYVYLMHVVCSETDVVVGSVSHDRPAIEDGDKILGCFLNSIPVRISIEDKIDYRSIIRAVNEYLIEVKNHEIHLTDIATAVGDRSGNHNPFFDCILNFIDFRVLNDQPRQLGAAADSHEDRGSNQIMKGNDMTNTLFDLEISLMVDCVGINLHYLESYFSPADVAYALKLYERILKQMGDNVYATLVASKLLTPEERNSLVYDFNDTITPYSESKTLQQLFEERVVLTPEAIAFKQDHTTLTYEALNARANSLARHLLKEGLQGGDAVALITDRNVNMITGMLAILKCGACYVPIDPAYPVERQIYILKNARATFLLADKEYSVLSDVKDRLRSYVIVNDVFSRYDNENINIEKSSAELAYIIYTSGSTGNPKGVMIAHHAAVNLVEWVNRQFNVGSHDRLLFITSMCFDLSVYDVFGMLAAGGTIVMARQDQVHDVRQLANLLKSERITFWDSVPSIFNVIIQETPESASDDFDLRLVFLSGDWIPVNLPEKVQKKFKRAQVISLGGATEGTVWSNFYPIDKVDPQWPSIPYGVPIANNFFYILDRQLQPVPRGVVGDLYIGGAGVALGYANNPQKTSASFVKNPFTPALGGMMYRTGDLGRMREDGNMEFIGRSDHQVKVRGYRVELGEIEHQILKLPHVDDAVVEAFKDSTNNNYLCAFYVANQTLSVHQLTEHLKTILPHYMIPQHFVRLMAIPLTSNGKVNRQAFLPPVTESSLSRQYIAPETDTEKQIADLWSELLNVEQVGRNDNFFELGGNSITAIALVARLQAHFKLTLTDVFRFPVVSELAQQVVTDEGYLRNKLEGYIRLLEAPKDNVLHGTQTNHDVLKKRNDALADYRRTIKAYTADHVAAVKAYDHILLVGATGFLGIHMLHQLLQSTRARISMILRKTDDREVLERIKHKLKFYFADTSLEKYSERINVYAGDLLTERFGLSPITYQSLISQVDCIINTAANVRHYGRLEEFVDVNVSMVNELIAFASSGKSKDIHHVSTVGVASGKINGTDHVIFTESDCDLGQESDNYYLKTKLDAEKALVAARKNGVVVNIYRVGNLVFDSRSGIFQENITDNAFYSKIKAFIALGKIPDHEPSFALSTIDQVAQAIVTLFDRRRLLNETFHIQNSNAISAQFFATCAEKSGHRLNLLSTADFIRDLLDQYQDHREVINDLLLRYNIFDREDDDYTQFEVLSERTDHLLKLLEFEWLKFEHLHIQRMLRHCEQVEFIGKGRKVLRQPNRIKFENMEYRKLGNSGLRVSALSLGSWITFGDQIGNKIAKELMSFAYDNGINFFDNAEVYAEGRAELVMGEILKKSGWTRDSYILSSKVFWGGKKPTQFGLSRKHIFDACHASLKRMQTEYIDLYYCHRPDHDTPIEETVRAMSDLIQQGKILYWGTSEWSYHQIKEAHGLARKYFLTPPTMEQPQYNLFNREKVEIELKPLCEEIGLGITSYSPLFSGILTSKYHNGNIPSDSRLSRGELNFLRDKIAGESAAAIHDKVAQLSAIAKQMDVSLPSLAIAWILKNPDVSSVILGASHLNQLKENFKALEVSEVIDDQLYNTIDDLFSIGEIKLQ